MDITEDQWMEILTQSDGGTSGLLEGVISPSFDVSMIIISFPSLRFLFLISFLSLVFLLGF